MKNFEAQSRQMLANDHASRERKAAKRHKHSKIKSKKGRPVCLSKAGGYRP